jgi:hypothetical protein
MGLGLFPANANRRKITGREYKNFFITIILLDSSFRAIIDFVSEYKVIKLVFGSEEAKKQKVV